MSRDDLRERLEEAIQEYVRCHEVRSATAAETHEARVALDAAIDAALLAGTPEHKDYCAVNEIGCCTCGKAGTPERAPDGWISISYESGYVPIDTDPSQFAVDAEEFWWFKDFDGNICGPVVPAWVESGRVR